MFWRGVFYLFMLALLGVIMYGWAVGNYDQSLSIAGGRLNAIGRLFGLIAALAVLLELVLMSRLPIVERNFDLQDVIDLHRLTGYTLLVALTSHLVFILYGYAALTNFDLWKQFLDINADRDVLFASIGSALFIAIMLVTVKLVRKKLRYEVWYTLHLVNYLAIGLTFLHQLSSGEDFAKLAWFKYFWYGLYGAVALLWLWCRLLRPYVLSLWYGFKVQAVERAAANTYSVYISGRRLERFKFEPGQYANWRILAPHMWLQVHPFSISSPLHNNLIRFTAKATGDYTARFANLQPGARVIMDGPRGSFGADRADGTAHVVLIAGGIGVTPYLATVRALLLEGKRVTILYAAKAVSDVAFIAELSQLQAYGLEVRWFIGEYGGYITSDVLAQYAVTDTTIFICGPDGMSRSFQKTLHELNFPRQRIIIERFAL